MAGNDREMAEMVAFHYQGMVRKARALLRSDMDAEDAVQDAMLSLLEAPHLFSTIERFGGWLSTLVVRRCVDLLRSKVRRREKEANAAVGEMIAALGADDLVESTEFARAVAEAIDGLPEELRSVFVQNALEGVTFREISSVTGISMGTLMARKKRAMDLVREHMRRQGFPV
jgi:RNA polymerase sigma-70 factor (ECF subfamily)